MPQGMLTPSDFPGGFPGNEQRRLDRIAALVDGLKTAGEPEDLQQQRFRELKSLLDDLLDMPHRVVSGFITKPDQFLQLLIDNDNVRSRFENRLSNDATQPRRMMWMQDDALIDEWLDTEIAIARNWLTNGTTPMTLEEKMLELIEAKRQSAINSTHEGIVVGQSNLKLLFEQNEFEQILRFLKDGQSTDGGDLIIPRDPDNSVFYQKITSGGMRFFFEQPERDLVRDWIMSL